MNISRWTLRSAALIAALFSAAAPLAAQGVTTGAISGTVTNPAGQPMADAQVQVTNRSTGARAGSVSRSDGRYYVPQLEVGGPYSVTVRHIGYAARDSNNIMVSLGQNVRVDFALTTQAAQLSAVTVTATTENAVIAPSHTGVSQTITDSTIARLPTANRNFTDFLTVVPQISTKGPGNSGGGENNRFNAIQIDGSIATDLFGLGSTGQPGGQANAKQAPLGAIKEYQVLLAPYDVRQGNFTGFLLNAVTKEGTNEVHGEAFGVYRNEKMERDVPFLRGAPFTQDQYGLSVGGPIIRDRLHYFVSAEFEQKSTPASGPYFNQPSNAAVPVPVSATDWQTFADTLQKKYGYGDLGSIGQLTDKNPLTNVFARVDYSDLPANSRLVLRYNYASGNIDQFPVGSSACNRSASSYCASNSGYNFNDATNNELGQLFSNFNNGGTNELLVSHTTISDLRKVGINAPFVQVKGVTNPVSGGTNTILSAGTDNSSQGNALDQRILELTDNYTMPFGSHRVTLGTKNEFYHVRNLFSQNSLGFYTFGNLDSLNQGLPDRVQIGKKLDNTDGSAQFSAHSYGFYLQDDWQATNNLALTIGLRADLPGFDSHPGTNATIQTLLGINTANVPTTQVQWGPRVGFNWDVKGDQTSQLRGGTGIFVGQPAFVWLSDAFGNSGVNGFATFTCSSPATAPKFPGANGPIPQSCSNGSAATPVTINTVDPKLKFPAAWRSSLGYDHRLPWDVIGTVEGLYTRMVDQFFYQNIGLQDQPIGVDSHGRALYGNLTGTTGQFTTLTTQYKAGLSDVINIGNETTNKDYSYGITGQLQKRFSNSFEGSLAYTYSRSYDQYDLTSSVAYSNWQFGRAYSGPQSSQILAPGKWDIPHRIVASGTYTFPSKTDLGFIFTAESGAPYTWVYSGDINGDGSANNDPMFIPSNSHDATQIVFSQNGAFTPAAQADSMDAFINRNSCLASQKGKIMSRDSCRLPWSRELDLSLRQPLNTLHGEHFILELDAFNFLNLLNKAWGAQPFNGGGLFGSTNDPFILTRKSFTGGNDLRAGAQPVFNYSTNFNLTTTQNVASNYRLQAQIKYTF